MGHAKAVLALSIAALLAGCDASKPGDGEDRAEQAPQREAPDDDGSRMAPASLGPIRYEFDPAQLLMAEVLVEIPPGDDEQHWGVKLIPAGRADLLGQEVCRYGRPVRDQTCEANKEPGLALALLTRPLQHYQEAFAESGLAGDLAPTRLDGSSGFTYTAEARGGRIEYRFLPLGDRTVLVAWQSIDGSELGHEAIRDVIRRLAAGLDALHEQSD